MATTLKQLKQKTLRLLGDVEQEDSSPLAGNVYSAELLLDSCHAALKRVSNRLWKNNVHEYTEDGTEFLLPLDIIDIQGVFDMATGMFLPKVDIAPGQVLSLSSSANAWIDYPGNSLTFLKAITGGAKLYYLAHWALPSNDGDELECPEICVTALSLYSASHCLIRSSVESGDIAQFKTKVDAGRPTDIPAKELSDWLLRRFESEISSWPTKQRY